MIRSAVAVLLISSAVVGYSATLDCSGEPYEVALCWYQSDQLDRAATAFEQIVEEGRRDPVTLKAIYFLARTKMRQEKWSEASRLLVDLFGRSPAFYREWSGDYLLGVCRREGGQD